MYFLPRISPANQPVQRRCYSGCSVSSPWHQVHMKFFVVVSIFISVIYCENMNCTFASSEQFLIWRPDYSVLSQSPRHDRDLPCSRSGYSVKLHFCCLMIYILQIEENRISKFALEHFSCDFENGLKRAEDKESFMSATLAWKLRNQSKK